MAYVNLFITFTCNPTWDGIKELLLIVRGRLNKKSERVLK